MYSNIRESCYNLKNNKPISNPSEFSGKALIIHVESSRQCEVIQTGGNILIVKFEIQDVKSTDSCILSHITRKKLFLQPIYKNRSISYIFNSITPSLRKSCRKECTHH